MIRKTVGFDTPGDSADDLNFARARTEFAYA
jgi:hypothetical protein